MTVSVYIGLSVAVIVGMIGIIGHMHSQIKELEKTNRLNMVMITNYRNEIALLEAAQNRVYKEREELEDTIDNLNKRIDTALE
jgi:chromosome segregation ATPase